MKDTMKLGLWRCILPLPRPIWQSQIKFDDRQLDFMSADHHRVRNFCVTELPRAGQPLTPAYTARALDLPVDRVVPILDELEQHMTFLFRNREGAVTWAYPVTVDVTPHRVTFSTGEQVYAA
jgi:hypothetical protein